jgi:nucleoside-diphosphate-sugar epimerase
VTTVLLTGASGFLGIHTLKQLLDDGHHVRAFVRTPARLEKNLLPLGIELEDSRIEVAEGDMTSTSAVRTAASGCGAVIHAAATFSYKRRDQARMARENSVGTRTVLESGAEAGATRLVHVSSTVALVRPGGATIDHTSPLGIGQGPYSKSKIASEAVARELQDSGPPVTIVNPGGILGPHDPYLGENNEVLIQAIKGRTPAWPRGSVQYVDVRDVAAVLAAAVSHAAGKRYLVPGHDVHELHPVLREVTGRRLPAATMPPKLLIAAALPGYLTGWSFLPGAVEGIRTAACANPADASATTRELGVKARPLAESVRDTVRWLVEAGHIEPKHAGRALD